RLLTESLRPEDKARLSLPASPQFVANRSGADLDMLRQERRDDGDDEDAGDDEEEQVGDGIPATLEEAVGKLRLIDGGDRQETRIEERGDLRMGLILGLVDRRRRGIDRLWADVGAGK
ncbi:hypothetical protein HDU98_002183, partial [Podochytrium sp. JEL0797]